MTLPNGDRAVVDIVKIRDYCLDAGHPQGRYKARVFRSALRLTQSDASVLWDALLRAAGPEEATPGVADEFGTRYALDFEMVHGSRRAVVRSGWIILNGERAPRLTTCYVR